MKHYFDGILRRIYEPSKKFFIKSLRILKNAPTPLTSYSGNIAECANIAEFANIAKIFGICLVIIKY
jgi:hypothetical protein